MRGMHKSIKRGIKRADKVYGGMKTGGRMGKKVSIQSPANYTGRSIRKAR